MLVISKAVTVALAIHAVLVAHAQHAAPPSGLRPQQAADSSMLDESVPLEKFHLLECPR